MFVIFHLSLYEKPPIFSPNPFLAYLHAHKPTEAVLIDWDNFSEYTLQKQCIQLLIDCAKFLLFTQAEPQAKLSTLLPFLEKIIQYQEKGIWLGQKSNHAWLQRYAQRLQPHRFKEWQSLQEIDWEKIGLAEQFIGISKWLDHKPRQT